MPVTAEEPDASRAPLGTAVQRAVGLVALLVAVGVVVAPRMSMNAYDVAAAAAGVAAVVAGWVLAGLLLRGRLRGRFRGRFGRFRGRDRGRDRWWDAAAVVLGLLLTGVAWLCGYAGAYATTWDPSTLEYASGLPPGPDLVGYFSLYPNQRPFFAVARTVRSWIAGTDVDYATAFALLNTASFLVTAVAVYLVVRHAAGPRRGVLALLLLGLLVAVSPWMSVPYTDLPVLWVPIVAVALLAAAWRRGWPGRVVLAALGGAALAVGFLLKVTPVVGLVALLLALAVAATGRGAPGRRGLLVVGASAVAGFAVTLPALQAWVRSAEDLPPLRAGRSATPLTYVAAGMRTQTTGAGVRLYGSWDRDVVGQTQGRDAAAQNAAARRLIRAEWERRGLAGMLGFAVDKTLFNWGDGTFWARGEGRDAAAPALRRGPVADAVVAWNAPAGDRWRAHVLIAQVTWIAVLLGLGAGLLRSRYRPELLLMALTIAGIAAFTLLFQGRARYLLVHVPVVVALAACVVPAVRSPRGDSGTPHGSPPGAAARWRGRVAAARRGWGRE